MRISSDVLHKSQIHFPFLTQQYKATHTPKAAALNDQIQQIANGSKAASLNPLLSNKNLL